jgi:hypothetical protein
MEIKAPEVRREPVENILEKISKTINIHNKEVDSTKKECKHKVCDWMWLAFLLVAIIQIYFFNYVFGVSGTGYAILIGVIVVPISYGITKQRYCEPYYQNKKNMAYECHQQVVYFESELSELIGTDVVVFGKDFHWDMYFFIGDGGMHQDDYYSELYGGRWATYSVKIDEKFYSFNPYKDIVYT